MVLIELVGSLVAILVAAIYFTNAVEVLGNRLDIGESTVGSLLAAFGTALPETMIPIVAILGAVLTGRDPGAAGEVGIGAILGAPFLLGTLGMFVVGASILGFRSRREGGGEVAVDESSTIRDLRFFLIAFAVGGAAGIVTLPLYARVAVAVVVLGAYAFYVRQTLKSGGESSGEPEELNLWPSSSPAPLFVVILQVFGALGLMVAGSHFFVTAIQTTSEDLGIPVGLISLVLAPLATELPETLNSVIWLREDKDSLALGNITGAMVFQSTIPVSIIGLLFTRWTLNYLDLFAVAATLLSGTLVYAMFRREGPLRAGFLLVGGAFYAVFVVVAVLTIL